MLSLVNLHMLLVLCFVVTTEASVKKVSALYVFGDFTVDPGNNNFLNTAFTSNFPPYGIDLPNHVPTGRFTNGKLGTDFLGIIFFTYMLFMVTKLLYIIVCLNINILC